MDYAEHGFLKIAAIAPPISVADPAANANTILAAYSDAPADAAVVLFPELAVTGYTCEDLFFGDDLRGAAESALMTIAEKSDERVLVVGSPWTMQDGRLLNCAFVCRCGGILGAVPKIAQPNYDEFYEKRWFASGAGVAVDVDSLAGRFPLRWDQVFALGDTAFGIEICEDLWSPKPPSADLALGGAEILLNPSASTEVVGKADYRRDLVRLQSARTIAAYVYAGAGPTESTKDVVFGGHLIAAENGHLLGESSRFDLGGSALCVEVDCQRLRHDRIHNGTFAGSARDPVEVVELGMDKPPISTLARSHERHPFVPDDETELGARASEIMAIQSTGLARRMAASRADRLVIGISGGLDSAWACLVSVESLRLRELGTSALCALTMPGPGSSPRTIRLARKLASAIDVELHEVPIGTAVNLQLAALGHDGQPDPTFENVQARERTQILFNTAKQRDGIVVGTGDLSELALGWCTFNADQMANYNVNAGLPKTLVAYLVRWYAQHRAGLELAAVLERVLDTPISPELVPSEGDGIDQRTEDIIGPYELHDFFIYHYLRGGLSARKVLVLARRTFEDSYSADEVVRWLRVFLERFYAAQFKRTTLPPGPKIGTVSLSPRGDWRMPDEATADAILKDLDNFVGLSPSA